MGLFGGSPLKKLESELLTGRIGIEVALKLGSHERAVQVSGNKIVTAAKPLVAKGQRDAVMTAIEASRTAGNEPHELIWNDLLDQVVTHI
jgi:hypothetical protein